MESVRVEPGKQRGLLREAIRRSVVLWVVVGPLLAVCWRAGEGLPLGPLTLGIYLAVAALLILCEYALAFEEGWGTAIRGNATDFVYAGAGAAVEKLTLVLCAFVAASLGAALSTALGIRLWPTGWPFALQVLLALLVADVGTYLRHRLFHGVPALWRFHQIHHSATGLYWIRSAYTHPLEQFAIMLAIMLPISLLGAGETVVLVVAFAYGLSGLLQHANIDARSSVLNCVFATPEVHRFHHGANDRGNASNFSAFFVFMDMLFGTYCRPERHEAPRRVGLQGVEDFPGSFLTHLALPFRRDPVRARVDDDRWERSGAGVSGAGGS